jgi:hypothetical protein
MPTSRPACTADARQRGQRNEIEVGGALFALFRDRENRHML